MMIDLKRDVFKTAIFFIGILTFSLSSCSTFKGKTTDATTVIRDTVYVYQNAENINDDYVDLAEANYEGSSLHDTIWERDGELLLRDLDSEEYLSLLDEAWMENLYKNGVLVDHEENNTHQSNVLRAEDALIKERLELLNQKTPLDLDYNPIVKRYIDTYLYKKSALTEKMLGLANYYYPLFEEVLDKYDIPLELKHLAIVESALNPRAKSRVGASGLWQFMYGTGKAYNLDVSSYVDERYDPVKATEAAAKYMRDLYTMLGDWNLVLAAYNSGPGNVRKAIRRSGGYRNYWYIRPYLPRETRGYVPAFIAVNYAMNYAKEHNLKVVSPKVSYYKTDTVKVKTFLTFDQIAKELNIEKSELEFFNPAFKHNIIPQVKKDKYTLVLPLDKIDTFVANEDSIYKRAVALYEKNKNTMPKYIEQNDMIRYRVRSGDNLGYIAQKYGVRVSEIKKWNRLRSNNINIGQRLTIYPRKFNHVSSNTSSKKTSTKAVSKVDIKGGYSIYTVKSGDNLWLIAKKYPGVSADNIRAWNGISNTRSLKPGMKLKIAKQG